MAAFITRCSASIKLWRIVQSSPPSSSLVEIPLRGLFKGRKDGRRKERKKERKEPSPTEMKGWCRMLVLPLGFFFFAPISRTQTCSGCVLTALHEY